MRTQVDTTVRSIHGVTTIPESGGILHEEFEVRDARGRSIGAFVAIFKEEFLPAPEGARSFRYIAPGTYFAWRPQATRDMKSFGAYAGVRYCKTETERTQQVEAYFASARKRAEKNAA